jgi:hypothetical protein
MRDTEVDHYDADQLLIELLKEIGLDDIAEAYDRIAKWYA